MKTLYIVCGLVVLVVLIALGITLFNVSRPAQPPSSGVYSPSDSPYVPTSSQQRSYLPLHSPAIRYFQIPSGYDRLQAPSQPSSYQPHRLPGAQYPPSATTPQQSHRPVARAPLVVPVVIDPRERPTAKAPEVPVARVVIDPYEDPKSLRLKATQEGDRMGKCFKERNEAKARNDQQRARELTQRGEAHRANMMLLDKEASAKIFQENNQNLRNKVELHGLYVSEAESYFDISVQEARDREESSLRVIVGKGIHSDNNIPKIKPAILAHAKSLGLPIEVDPRNEGCLIVSLK